MPWRPSWTFRSTSCCSPTGGPGGGGGRRKVQSEPAAAADKKDQLPLAGSAGRNSRSDPAQFWSAVGPTDHGFRSPGVEFLPRYVRGRRRIESRGMPSQHHPGPRMGLSCWPERLPGHGSGSTSTSSEPGDASLAQFDDPAPTRQRWHGARGGDLVRPRPRSVGYASVVGRARGSARLSAAPIVANISHRGRNATGPSRGSRLGRRHSPERWVPTLGRRCGTSMSQT